MSYSIFAAIFLATIALASASSVPVFSNEQNVLVRFYPNYAQVYRPATIKSYVDNERTMERYQFFFSYLEYSRIFEQSFTLLHANVIERTITYHPAPNFAVNGTRYFYRRDPKQIDAIEIELVNPKDHIFREVARPDRYFYLSFHEKFEYVGQMPVMPYINITYICNASSSTRQSPLLSYIDWNLTYSSRYILNIPSLESEKPVEISAFADIKNFGQQNIIVKGAELIAGDISLSQESSKYFRSVKFHKSFGKFLLNQTRPLGQQEVGSYVYELSVPSAITIPAYSVKSLPFLQINVTIDHTLQYSSIFSPMNSKGKLLNVHNLTTGDSFFPRGYAHLYNQGRTIGLIYLPNLLPGEHYEIVAGTDADTSYNRRVTRLPDDENSDSISYFVEYVFTNSKPTYDISFQFFESFSLFQSFEIENLSVPNARNNLPNVVLNDKYLRGYVFVPRQDGETKLSYNLIVPKATLSIEVY